MIVLRALPWFAHVPPTNERSVEAIFLPLAFATCASNQPDKAEKTFQQNSSKT